MKWPFSFHRSSRRIYLDYAAATPVRPEVFACMRPYLTERFGNAGAVHREGVEAQQAVAEARKDIAATLRVRPDDIIFTAGGTEANNLALMGTIDALHASGRAYRDMEILSTEIEHPSILRALEVLAERGVRTTFIPVDAWGRIEMSAFASALSEETVLVTCAYVNSEIGVIQDVKKIARTVQEYNRNHDTHVVTHIDASQAPLWLPCQIDSLGIDLMTLDGGKCYGPKGIGVLVRRRAVSLTAQTVGGEQEMGFRAGTENVAAIVGCAQAIVLAQYEQAGRSARVSALRDSFLALLTDAIPEAVLNGSSTQRVANNINISISGYDSEYAVIVLDYNGIAASTRSACGSAGSGSHVVRVIAGDERAAATLRFSLGEETTRRDIRRVVSVLKTHIDSMREFHQSH